VSVSASSRVPVVIWDLDGTLVRLDVSRERISWLKQKLAARFRPYGFDAPFSPLLPSLEAALDRASRQLSSPEESEALRNDTYAFLDQWEAQSVSSIDVVSGTAKLAARWTAESTPMALVTNNGPTAAGRALEALSKSCAGLGLPLPQFVHISSRGPRVRAKPDPGGFRDAFRALCAASPRPVTDLLVIGDGSADWQAAVELAREITVPVWTVVPSDDRLTWSETPAEDPPLGMEPDELLAELGLSQGRSA